MASRDETARVLPSLESDLGMALRPGRETLIACFPLKMDTILGNGLLYCGIPPFGRILESTC